MSHYVSADSPKINEVEQYNSNVKDASSAIQEFHQLTRTMQQKMDRFHTPQDSRANHQQIKELSEKGNQLVTKINRRLRDLTKACQGPGGRTRKTQVNKLSSDYKNQLKAFEATCQELVESETAAVDNIRRSSSSFRGDEVELGEYSEDQIYTQAQVTHYNEDDLMRREDDIVQINHQMREVNAAFKEVDEMVTEQGEVVLEIEENANDVKDNVDGALDNVRQADHSSSYCVCSRNKMICYGVLILVVVVVVVSLVSSLG